MIKSNKTKHLLVENELKKQQTLDWSYFMSKNYYENDGTQNYLLFQPMNKYFKKISSTDGIQIGSINDYLMKLLNLLLHPIIVSLQHQIMLETK